MIVCAAGDTHGAFDRLYEDIHAFEVALAEHGRDWSVLGEWPQRRRDPVGPDPAAEI